LVENKFDGVVLEFWAQLGGQAKFEAAELVCFSNVSKMIKKFKNVD